VQDECLEVQQPHREHEHCRDDYNEKSPCAGVTERSERGRTKSAEVSYSSKCCGRNSSDLRVSAAKNNRTRLRRAADGVIACEVRNGEISSIGQSGQSDYRSNCIENDARAGERISRTAFF